MRSYLIETPVGRPQSDQPDTGFFYSTETSDAKIPAIELPAQITPKNVYTVMILRGAAIRMLPRASDLLLNPATPRLRFHGGQR